MHQIASIESSAAKRLRSASAMFVAAGEIAVALEHVLADDRLPADGARVVACALEVGFVAQRARRRDERDA